MTDPSDPLGFTSHDHAGCIRDAVAAEGARLRRLETGRRTLEELFTGVDA